MAENRLNLPYTGNVTFLRAPLVTDLDTLDADIAVIGVPSDEGSPWKPGSRFAPRAIREQSMRFPGYRPPPARPGYYDVDEARRYLQYETQHRRIVDCGDVDVIFTNRAVTYANTTDAVRRIVARGAIPAVLGGDHGISFPVIRALATGEHGRPLQIVQFDAHLDFQQPTAEVELSNGTGFRLAAALPNVRKIVQIGLRGVRVNEDDLAEERAHGATVLSVTDFRRLGIEAVLAALSPDLATYISIDADAFDLPLVPGCASAELNGLLYDEVRQTIFAVARHTEVIGFDVVEINPMLDVASGATSYLGAQITLETMARIVEHPAYRRRKGHASGA